MIRIALTGKELASLYALQAMGVPSSYEGSTGYDLPDDPQQRSFLVDTDEGRDMLIEHARDLSERIREENETRIQNYIDQWLEGTELDVNNPDQVASIRPDDDRLVEKAIEFLEEQADYVGLTQAGIDMSVYEESDYDPRQMRFNFQSSRDLMDMLRIAGVMPEIPGESTELDGLVERFATSVASDIGDSVIDGLILNAWQTAKWRHEGDEQRAIPEFKSLIRQIASSPYFIEAFWRYDLDENYDDYNETYREWNEPDPDEVREQVFEAYYDDEHILIDRACDELDSLIYEAERSGDREDYVAVMSMVDEFSSMSHHGGPAFEYADTTGWNSREPNLFEIMNRKFGDRFLPWLIASGNFPEEYLPALQEWYDERVEQEGHEAYLKDLERGGSDTENVGQVFNRQFSREDYYRHPYYSDRSRWLAQHSPTFGGWTPFDADLENRANVQSVARAMEQQVRDSSPRGDVMQAFLRNKGGYSLAEEPNVVDPWAPRPRWSRPDVEAHVIGGMVKTAARADRIGLSHIADEIDAIMMAMNRRIRW